MELTSLGKQELFIMGGYEQGSYFLILWSFHLLIWKNQNFSHFQKKLSMITLWNFSLREGNKDSDKSFIKLFFTIFMENLNNYFENSKHEFADFNAS